MKCKRCKKAEVIYLFGFGLAIVAFNYLSFGCIKLSQNAAYGMIIVGISIMLFGAFLKSER
jgi:hypothetical protein